MDVANHFWLRQREQVTIVQKALRRVLESLPADIRFRHAVGADGRAHRSVDDRDSILQDLFERMLVDFLHVFLMTLSGLRFGLNLATLPEVSLVYYSEWQDIQVLRRVITDVVVIALKLSLGPKGLTERTPLSLEDKALHGN